MYGMMEPWYSLVMLCLSEVVVGLISSKVSSFIVVQSAHMPLRSPSIDNVLMFYSGNAGRLYESVHSQVFSLPDHYVIYPAHDYTGKLCAQ